MIRGRFGDTSGRPFIEGRLIIKKLRVYDYFSFCIDTGSDETVLLPSDSRKTSLDFSKLKDKTSSCTLNGTCELFVIPAIIQFFEPSSMNVYSYDIELKIAPFNPDLLPLPSIVGRDVIDHWSINYCRTQNRLDIKVLSADRTSTYIMTP
jgi:hypothetical protein